MKLNIRTSGGTSVVYCGKGAFARYAPLIKGKKIIVTDSTVYSLYCDLLEQYFPDSPVISFPAGERSKTLKTLTAILSETADLGAKRGWTIVAFGGGVVGDVAGLAASLYMRGVNLVQIPTTLLSQVDSSVGGKTAVDFKGVKNLVGTFYQPSQVIVDPIFLNTLKKRDIRCGLGEIIKYGALDENIYKKLTENKDKLFNLGFLASVIPLCIRHKARVVTSDERDINGIRKTLNLGHTTSHALELYYGRKTHGEYVLIGMYYELYIAEKLKIGGGGYFENLRSLIKSVIKIPVYSDIEIALAYALMDKKNTDGEISLVAPAREGKSAEIKLPFQSYVGYLKEIV